MAVVVMFSFAAPSMAKGVKVPKTLCVETDPGGSMVYLGMKKGAKLVVGGNKIDMYSVQGLFGGVI